jgi:hypothetical protein
LPLFSRCSSLLSVAVFDGKCTNISGLQGMIAKFPDISGIGRVSGDGRAHPYGALRGFAANFLQMQQKSGSGGREKAASGETGRPVFPC